MACARRATHRAVGAGPVCTARAERASAAVQALLLTNGAAGHGGLGGVDDDDALSIDSQGTL